MTNSLPSTLTLGEFGPMPVYFLAVSLTFALCLLYTVWRADHKGRDRRAAIDLIIICFVFGLIGARVFHIFFENFSFYRENPIAIFYITWGGFVWYGGFFLAIAVSLLYVKKKSLPLWTWLDFASPIVALGYGLGRTACLITGCCYGRICNLGELTFRFPSQGFAIVWELCVFVCLLSVEKKNLKTGQLFSLWLGLHALGRIIMELMRDDPRGPSLGLFTISLTISLAILGGSAFLWKALEKNSILAK